MATTIEIGGDTIKIDKKFVSGKDRIVLNDDVVFEGKFPPGSRQEFRAGARRYEVETKVAFKWTGAIAIHIHVYEEGELLHAGVFDQAGRPVENVEQAGRSAAVHMCAVIGGGAGLTAMTVLITTTGVVPGGAIGVLDATMRGMLVGAIGGVLVGSVSWALGYGIGWLMFGQRK